MNFSVNTAKVKNFLFNGNKVKQFDVIKNGLKATVYKAELQIFPVTDLSKFVKTGSSVINAEYLQVSSSSSAYVRTAEMIDLTDYSTVTFKCSEVGSSSNWTKAMGVTTNASPTSTSRYAVYKTTRENGDIVVDVSQLTGNYYIAFSIHTSSGQTGAYKVTSIILE